MVIAVLTSEKRGEKMDRLTILKGRFPKKDWYWGIRTFSNRGAMGGIVNSSLEESVFNFFREVNVNPSMEVEQIKYLNGENGYTDVFITYKYKLSEKELEKENKKRENFFKKSIDFAKSRSEKEDFPNEIAKNLWMLRVILNESQHGFAFLTGIKESDIKAVEKGNMEITEDMLRAIKERFPSISIKTFTNGKIDI